MKVMVPKVNLFGVPVAKLTMSETITVVKEAIDQGNQLHHSVINAGKVVLMQKDLELKKSVINADLINADGMAIVWAGKILGKKLPERVTGIDLMINLVQMAYENGHSCYFLGAKKEIVEKVVEKYSEEFSPNVIAGYHDGYFTQDQAEQVAQEIQNSGANILFVAITSPKKEIFLDSQKNNLSNVNMIMGVGGSFDVIAGKVERAPFWMQNAGLEWFYRFIQEPRRMWKRYILGNLKFLRLTINELFIRRGQLEGSV